MAEVETQTVPAGDEAEPIELTILMPCLNEAETLATCIAKARGYLARAGISGEVVVADNGSTDGSREIAVREGARLVPVETRGYGAALIGGLVAARGTFVIMGDADDSYDFSDLDGYMAALREGHDLVMGNRFKGGIAAGAMPVLHRLLGNPVLSWIGRVFFRIPVGDFHCGLRGFRRTSIQALGLTSPGMEFASEMVVKASINGLSLAEVPTTLSPDGRSRAPHLKTWRDGWRHLRFLLLHSPKWLFAYPGLVLTLLGLIGASALLLGPLEIAPGVVLDVHTLTASCFALLIGTQFLTFAVLARSYASSFAILPPTRRLEGVFAVLTLERLLQLAVLLFLAGLGGAIWAVTQWALTGFGDIEGDRMLRWFMLSLTGVAMGIQLAASAFLGSFMRLRSAG